MSVIGVGKPKTCSGSPIALPAPVRDYHHFCTESGRDSTCWGHKPINCSGSGCRLAGGLQNRWRCRGRNGFAGAGLPPGKQSEQLFASQSSTRWSLPGDSCPASPPPARQPPVQHNPNNCLNPAPGARIGPLSHIFPAPAWTNFFIFLC